MKKILLLIAALLAPLPAAAVTVNLDATKGSGSNAGLLYKSASGYYLDALDTRPRDATIKYLSLAAGSYAISPTLDLYDSWSRWRHSAGCDSSGANCLTGYEYSFGFFMPDTAIAGAFNKVGITNSGQTDSSLANLVNQSPFYSGNFFGTGQQGYDAVKGLKLASFTLASAQDVGFFIHDTFISDNRGASASTCRRCRFRRAFR